VNAANSALMGGGGVDGAIHERGGPSVTAACGDLRRTQFPDGLPVGEAVMTVAGNLPARFVVHTVGPIWGSDQPAHKLLASCYRPGLRGRVEVDFSPGDLDRRLRLSARSRRPGGIEGDCGGARQGALGQAGASGFLLGCGPRHLRRAPAVSVDSPVGFLLAAL